jgi:N4-gp56 family major capsid protein
MSSGITGTPVLSPNPTAYNAAASSMVPQAIQVVWSKEILFQAMPILRMEQFAVKKTELGVAPGLQVNFLRWRNLDGAKTLVEGVRMETAALSAEQIVITVAEQGFAVAVTELLLNASFDDVMASGARLLGRNMAVFLDSQCRDVLMNAVSVLYGYNKLSSTGARTQLSPYDGGTAGTSGTIAAGQFDLTAWAVKDISETLASKNVPRLGETYVCFVHPHQSRRLRNDPEFIEVTKYAAPGNFMLGEIGRLNDVVFIETTQVFKGMPGDKQQGSYASWPSYPAASPGTGSTSQTPGGMQFPGGPTATPPIYTALAIGDNAFGHAISLPVELRDGGVLDFGREHALAWYSIWGLGLITDYAVVQIKTN